MKRTNGNVHNGKMIKKIKISLLIVFLVLISVIPAFMMIKWMRILISDMSLTLMPVLSTYYAKSYSLEHKPSVNGSFDTLFSSEIWFIDIYHFREKYYNSQKFPSPVIKLRNGTDTLYVFFLSQDTVYAIFNTLFQPYVPHVSYLLSKSILEEPPSTLLSILTTSQMNLFYYERNKMQNEMNTEFSIWINTKDHLLLYQNFFEDSSGKKTELWSWHSWNLHIPDTIFTLPRNATLICKDKSFYDSLFAPGPKIIIKKFEIPPINTWWYLFKINLKRLFNY